MRGHTGETPYHCKQCDNAYTSKSALVRHVRTHSGIKPHKCPHCDAAYHDKKNLLAHSYKHTGIKPFSCKMCGFACVKKFNLDMHIRQTHGPEHLADEMKGMVRKKPTSFGRPRKSPIPSHQSVRAEIEAAAKAVITEYAGSQPNMDYHQPQGLMPITPHDTGSSDFLPLPQVIQPSTNQGQPGTLSEMGYNPMHQAAPSGVMTPASMAGMLPRGGVGGGETGLDLSVPDPEAGGMYTAASHAAAMMAIRMFPQ